MIHSIGADYLVLWTLYQSLVVLIILWFWWLSDLLYLSETLILGFRFLVDCIWLVGCSLNDISKLFALILSPVGAFAGRWLWFCLWICMLPFWVVCRLQVLVQMCVWCMWVLERDVSQVLKVSLFKNLPTFTDLYSTSSFVGLVIVFCGNWKLGLGKPYFWVYGRLCSNQFAFWS